MPKPKHLHKSSRESTRMAAKDAVAVVGAMVAAKVAVPGVMVAAKVAVPGVMVAAKVAVVGAMGAEEFH
jgi:hypothetical protein